MQNILIGGFTYHETIKLEFLQKKIINNLKKQRYTSNLG